MARRRRGQADTTSAAPDRSLALYRDVEREAGDALREAAAADLRGDLALLRRLLRRQIEQDPDNLDLTIKAMHLLVRMVTAQHKLSGGDAAALEAQVSRLANELALAILGKEPEDG